MFNDRLSKSSGSVHSDALGMAKQFKLSDHKAEISNLSVRLYCGDWTTVPRIAELHMFLCGLIGRSVAISYRQDMDDMVSWAYLGIVDACSQVITQKATIENLTGFILSRAKSFAVNNIEDKATGYGRYEIAAYKENAWHVPEREEMPDVAGTFDELEKIDFLDAFLPLLDDQELDLFCLLLKCYADDEAAESMGIRRARFALLKAGIENKFDTYQLEWYGPRRFRRKQS